MLSDNATDYKYIGVLPFCQHNGNIMILLGKEPYVDNWKDSMMWSDFGGKPEKNEKCIQTASRECFEETLGILGCNIYLAEQLSSSKSIFIEHKNAIIYLLKIDYNESIPLHYNRIYSYFTKCTIDHPKIIGLKKIANCPDGYYEKTELKWMSLVNLKNILESDQAGQTFRKSFIDSIKFILSNIDLSII